MFINMEGQLYHISSHLDSLVAVVFEMLLAVFKVLPLLEALPVGLRGNKGKTRRRDSKVLAAYIFSCMVGVQTVSVSVRVHVFLRGQT